MDDPARTDEGRFCLRSAPASSFTFDTARYDAETDELHLTAGPDCAGTTESTPEGHVVRLSAPDGRVCGLTLVGVMWRLRRDGHVRVTLCASQQLVLDASLLLPLIES